MALNRDLKVIEQHKLITKGIVRGGADKQMVANQIGKFLDADDKKGLDKYISDLVASRTADKVETSGTGNPEQVNALTGLINEQRKQIAAQGKLIEEQGDKLAEQEMTLEEQQEQLSQLNEKITAVEATKGTAKPTEVNK